MTPSGVGFTPAPTMARKPHTVMKIALKRPSQLSRPSVRGSETTNVATAKMASSTVAHRPLLDRVESACCPESNSEPYARAAARESTPG